MSYTDRSITLEDIAASNRWRLGQPEDLSDPNTAAAIARWYRILHERGRGVVTSEMYDESDLFTLEKYRDSPPQRITQDTDLQRFLLDKSDGIQRRQGSVDVRYNLITLILASRQKYFPYWAEPSRAALVDLPSKIERLILAAQ